MKEKEPEVMNMMNKNVKEAGIEHWTSALPVLLETISLPLKSEDISTTEPRCKGWVVHLTPQKFWFSFPHISTLSALDFAQENILEYLLKDV